MKKRDTHSDARRLLAAKRKNIRPSELSISSDSLVSTGYFDSDRPLPLVIEPKIDGVNLALWVKDHWELVESKLLTHGGILFRGFDVKGQSDFEEFLRAMELPLMEYLERSTPRAELGKGVYTSTQFPPDQSIALHNELSAALIIPRKIWFCCIKPAEEGGETPIADIRRIFQRLDPSVRERFLQKGWLLIRNYGDGFGLPWQDSFQTTDKSVIEEYARKNAMDVEWKDGDRLRTYQIRPAVIHHPQTGEIGWFNHIAFWHQSSLTPDVHEALSAEFKDQEFPYFVSYGDGSPIDDKIIDMLRDAYQREMIVFPWRTGDLLMLDNMLVAHGRRPYVGTRNVVVSMGEPYTRQDIRQKGGRRGEE